MFSKKILSRADDKSGAKTLAKDQDKERGLRNKSQQKIRELKTKTRAFEKNIIDRVIQSKNTDYLQRFIENKYKVSPFEALYIIINHDERAYIAVREIAMNSDEKKLGI